VPRTVRIGAGLAATVVVAWVVMHVVIQPVNPAQEAPEDHVEAACLWCHFVSEGVELVEPSDR